jgi:hypothetical protein
MDTLALANKAGLAAAGTVDERALLPDLNEATADLSRLLAELNEDVAKILAELANPASGSESESVPSAN